MYILTFTTSFFLNPISLRQIHWMCGVFSAWADTVFVWPALLLNEVCPPAHPACHLLIHPGPQQDGWDWEDSRKCPSELLGMGCGRRRPRFAACKHRTLLCTLRAQLRAAYPAVVTGTQLHWGLVKPKHSLLSGRKAWEQTLSWNCWTLTVEEEGSKQPLGRGRAVWSLDPCILPMEVPCTKGRQSVVWGSTGTPWRYLDSPSFVSWQAVCIPCMLVWQGE